MVIRDRRVPGNKNSCDGVRNGLQVHAPAIALCPPRLRGNSVMGISMHQDMTGQRGVALITALLVVALATVAAVAMASRQQVDIRRTANLLAADQAALHADGVVAWAGQMLRRDAEDSQTDARDEDWAQALPPIAVEGGEVGGRIEDMQARFNLNNLVRDGAVSEPDLERFRRLLAALELAPELADAVVDWVDEDIDPRFPGGAEDDAYLGRHPAYRTANAPLAHPAELRRIAGFDAETYAALAPYVTALPEPTPVNCNTAAAPVLRALAEEIGQGEAEAVVERRGDGGFDSVGDCLAQPAFAGREVPAGTVAVASRHFLVRARVRIGELDGAFFALLRRGEGGAARVVARGRGDYDGVPPRVAAEEGA